MNIARAYKRRISSSSDYARANAAERYTGNPAAITKVRRTADYSYDGNPGERDTFSPLPAFSFPPRKFLSISI